MKASQAFQFTLKLLNSTYVNSYGFIVDHAY